jgi:3'(2'), 5'-bisphosphate nucleotidase
MTNIIDLPALAEQLVAVALEAGAVIMQIYAAPAAARVKTDGSPVTEADERAEAVITQHLAALAPEIPIIAEEAVAAGRAPATAGNFFLVDPLDGTKEFISGNGEFTVNIALIQDGVPVWGVVYAPALGLIYTGGKEIPPRRGNVVAEKISGWTDLAVRAVPAALTVIGSRSHGGAETEAFIAKFPVAEFVAAGSSLKFCRLAEGAADLYPRMGRTMEWDIAAGDAVLRAAGGAVLTLDGAPLAYGKRNQTHDSDFANPHFVATGGFDPFMIRP